MMTILTSKGRADLCKIFFDLGFKRGAEIGVWTGEFSEQICQANPSVQLLCVDPWLKYPDYNEKKNNQGRLDEAYNIASHRLGMYDCVLMRMTSMQAAATVPSDFLDFVYIDGNHSKYFVDADLAAWYPKIRSGGIIAGHDYQLRKPKHWIQVKDAVDDFVKIHQIADWYVLAGDKHPSFYWVKP